MDVVLTQSDESLNTWYLATRTVRKNWQNLEIVESTEM